MKKRPEIIIFVVMYFIIIYFAAAFLMRDKGEGWCAMSLGEYKERVVCHRQTTMAIEKNCFDAGGFICSGGLFNLDRGVRGVVGKS